MILKMFVTGIALAVVFHFVSQAANQLMHMATLLS